MMTNSMKSNPLALLKWQKNNSLFFLGCGLLAWVLIEPLGLSWLQLPVLPLSVVGAALGIFVSFRANQSYDRWWEGRKLWGRLINTSRHFSHQCLRYLRPEDRALAERMVRRHMAYVHTLRCLLRSQDPFADEDFKRVVGEEEGALRGSNNLTQALLDLQLRDVTALADGGRLDERRLESFDRTLMDLLNIQGGCERIQGTPLPRGYGFIAELLIQAFAVLLPFSMVHDLGLMAIPMNVLVALSFALMSEAGRVIEDPWSLYYNGLPLHALSIKIERNLRERLGEAPETMPAPILPQPPGVLM